MAQRIFPGRKKSTRIGASTEFGVYWANPNMGGWTDGRRRAAAQTHTRRVRMKKGEIPQFNEAWWKKARPLLFTDPGLDKKLKDYEVAEDQFAYEKMLKSLGDIREMAKTIVGKCKDADTVEAMKKYPNLISTKENEIKKKISEAKLKESENKPVPQKIGGSVVIWKRDVAEEVKKKYPVKWLDFKGCIVQLKLNDDILDVLEKEGDHATPAFMVDDANELCEKVVDELIAKAKLQEPALKKGKKPEEASAELGKEVKTLVTNLGINVSKIPAARWNKFVAQKKQYKEYKIQSAQSVVLGTLGVIASGLSIAAAVPTGGATLALGIVGGVRSTAALLKTGSNLWKEAETVQNGLVADIGKLKLAYLDGMEKAKKTVGLQEIGAGILKGILGTHPPFIATVPKCQEDYKLWDNKVAHLVVNNRATSKEALALLDKITQLEKVMANAKSKDAGKILDKIRKLRKVVNDGLEKASTLGGRVSQAEKMMPMLKEALDMLAETVPKYAEIFNKIFPAIVNLALAGADAGVGFKEATNALDYYNTAQGLANDLLSEVNEQVSN
jgi:hypothetical protein